MWVRPWQKASAAPRLNHRLADVVADRAAPGAEPALEAGRVESLIPGLAQRRRQGEADKPGRVMSHRATRVPGGDGGRAVVQQRPDLLPGSRLGLCRHELGLLGTCELAPVMT